MIRHNIMGYKGFSILAVIFALTIAMPAFAGNYEDGMKAYSSGNLKGAKIFFSRALGTNSRDVNSRYMLAQIYVREKNYTAAKYQYQYIIKNAPKSLAATYSKQGLSLIANKANANVASSSTKSTAYKSQPKTVASASSKAPQKKVQSQFGVLKTDTIKTPNPTNAVLRYYYYVPESLEGKSGYPIIFYIHGMGGNGKYLVHPGHQQFANEHNLAIASITFNFSESDFQKKQSYQYPEAWAGQAFKDILAKLKSKNINFKDVYLMGYSAGAQFAGRFAMQNPNYLRGCVLLASGAKILPETAQKTRFYCIVGAKDESFRVNNYHEFLNKAKSLHMDASGKIFPKYNHNLGDAAWVEANNFVVQTMKMSNQ